MKNKSLFAVPFGAAIVILLLFSCLTFAEAQTSIHDLDNPARQPFQLEVTNQRILKDSPIPLFMIPVGKRLVIEQVFLELTTLCSQSDEETVFVVNLQTRGGGRVANHDLTITKRASLFSIQDYVASQLTRIYADPGSKVVLNISLHAPLVVCASTATVSKVILSGHYVDVSQPKSPS